ncbi:MAG TPA: NAD-reducing hydrogenase, alpha subunit [Algoriphagus sp.]|jgi:NADH:ubiquinone oxidoreductase subunit E|nr:NAD-reducing hydrogenase, alpha subunit [Algoriphagus sp.]
MRFNDAGHFYWIMKHSRQLVFICTGSDCKKAGSKLIKKDLKIASKQNPWKGCCKLIQTKCLDMCKSAPVAIVEDHFLKKTSTEKILDQMKKALKDQG